MADHETSHSRLSDSDDAEVAQYQAVSGLAVVALIFGLLSPLAVVHPSFWVIPLAGILLSLLALRQIARDVPARIGRKAARVGLAISMVSIAAGVSMKTTRCLMLDAEARRFTGYLFRYLRQDDAFRAHQLCQLPESRKPLNDPAWDARSLGPSAQRDLVEFVSRDEIRALLRLGDRARVRFYDTERRWREQGNELVKLAYAVTYDDAGQKKSFFVRVVAERVEDPETGHAYWYLADLDDPIRPEDAKAHSEHHKS
jgi:hypothetical protein